MRIVDNKALVFGTSTPDRITTTIEKSAVLGKIENAYEVAVKWGLFESQTLAGFGYNVPSPITRDYHWTGKHKPFDHQKVTSSFLTLYQRAFCFNEQGTGKTASVIWSADYLMNLGEVKRVLVLCPLSIMKSAWQQDLFKFAMHRSCSVAHGSAATRRKIIAAGSEFVIINFDGVAVVEKEITAAGFDLIVVDECFVAGTQVHTPFGLRAIETLKPGELVFTSNGVSPIKMVKRRTSRNTVRVRLANGEEFVCTAEHPFFTDLGWVAAENLTGRRLVSRAGLHGMRDGVPNAENAMGVAPEEGYEHRDDLLEILRAEEVARSQPQGGFLLEYAAGDAGEAHWGSAFARNARAYFEAVEGDRAPTPRSRGQWDRYDLDRSIGSAVLAPRLGVELPDSVGREAARLSYRLQGRLRAPGAEVSAGSGRGVAYKPGTSGTGPEEGGEARGTRVENVSNYEPGSEIPVFNLEVDGTPNFFVGGGWLTHNCNAYKNPQTNRWKVLKRIVDTTKAKLWMLTGTPAAQSPLDAYGLAKLVNPEGCPKYFGQFRDMTMVKVTQFKWVPRPQAEGIVHKVLQPAIRFERKDCLDLPEVTHVEREAPLTPSQKAYYTLLKGQMLFEADGEEVSAVNAAAKLNKLLQISGGAVYTDNHEVLEFDVSNRIKVVLEVIEEASHKVLVFVPFTHTIELLRETLEKAKISCEVINGKVSPNRRTEIVDKFQTEKNPHVLLIQPQAASHGLTLTEADTIIWYAPTTSVETYLQANARINRPGQKNAMTIVHVSGSPVEERLYKMLQGNIENHEKIIDLYRAEMASGR